MLLQSQLHPLMQLACDFVDGTKSGNRKHFCPHIGRRNEFMIKDCQTTISAKFDTRMNPLAMMAAEMRVLVGYLGEQAPAWWSSQFFSPSAAAFLTPVFARSLFQAQCQGVSAAASRLHDELIGVGRIVHLFRLPETFEQAIAAVWTDPLFEQQVRTNLVGRDYALARLAVLASAANAEEGPVVVGDWCDSNDGTLKNIAGLYQDAFSKGIKTFPYLREV